MNKGSIFVISGPSGVGKGSIVDGLLNKNKLKLVWAKSYTTRPKRNTEKSENHYLYIDENKFKKFENSGEIFESNLYNENWYGSSKSEIDKAILSGKNIIKEVEVNGAMVYKILYPDATLIFIKANLNDIKKRLTKRGQNTDIEIKDRLDIAQKELELENEYDYSVVNAEGKLKKAIEEIEQIIMEKISSS